MMKATRIFVLFLLAGFLLTGCGKDPTTTPTPSSPWGNTPPSPAVVNNGGSGNGGSSSYTPIILKVGETHQLGSNVAWSSDNTFVATVSNGTIKGEHIGKCTVSSSSGSYSVTVNANINLFREPITQWGINKSLVIAQEGNNYVETSDGAIGYSTGNTIAPLLTYTFENDRLKAAALTVKISYTNQAVEHLKERYRFLGYEGGAYYFADGVSSSDSKTAVVLQYFNTSYWAVMYTEHP